MKKAKVAVINQATAQNQVAVTTMQVAIAKSTYKQIKKQNKAVRHPTPAIKRMQAIKVASARRTMVKAE